MVDIAFVVLQYGGYEDTKYCMESIKKRIDTDSFAVVVVDNASPDSSYENVRAEIESYNDPRFCLIKAKKNLGFANGNNVGISFAREKLSAKFIAVINNDIELISANFYQTIQKKYDEQEFAVLGPLILSGDGQYTTNPMAMRLFTISDINHEIQHTERILRLNKLHLLKIYNLYSKIKSRRKSNRCELTNNRNDLIDVKLHGCFLVMSPTFFTQLTGFNPSTFLYMEEDILLLELLSKGLHTLYTSELCAFHKEGSTTAKVDEYNRVKFVFSNRLKSQKIYKEILQHTDMRFE